MTTPVQENLVRENEKYAAEFDKGHLPLPPARHYTVGQSLSRFRRSDLSHRPGGFGDFWDFWDFC